MSAWNTLVSFVKENPEATVILGREAAQIVFGQVVKFLSLQDHFKTPSNKRLVAQRLARMVIGGLLTGAAVTAFYTEPELRRRIWSAQLPWVTWWLRGITGHFIGDMLEILRARFISGCPPQNDMIAHHVVAFVVYVFGLKVYDPSGPSGAFYGVGAMTGEVLTLFSGPMFLLTALKGSRDNSTIQVLLKLIHWARTGTILLFRMPLWSYLLYRTVTESSLADGIRDPKWTQASMAWMFFACTYVLGMDVYWVRMLLGFKAKDKKLV